MSQLHRNVFYNIVGVLITTILTILVIPFQINILGLESFGIISFIATLQVALSALDLGLSNTISREIAADNSIDKKESNEVIKSAHFIYWMISVVLAALLYFNAESFARNWFNPEDIGPRELQQALQLIAIFLALRWPIAFYTGVLIGMQRLAALNVAKVLVTSIRLLVGIAVLLIWRTLDAYLHWLVISAYLETIFYIILTFCRHPMLPRLPGFSMPAVKRVWKFSLTMNVLAILGVALAQMDRFAVGLLLPLKELGRYNVAITAASLISLTVTSIGSAVMPQIARFANSTDRQDIATQYLAADRLTLFIVSFVSFMLFCYAEPLLKLWIGAAAAQQSADTLRLLSFGFWIAGLIYNLHNVAIAMAKPQIYVRVNLIALPLYAIALYVMVEKFGIMGAALSWVGLNVFYMATLVRPIQKNMIGVSTRVWVTKIIGFSFCVCASTILLPRFIVLLFYRPDDIIAAVISIALSSTLYIGLYVKSFGVPDFIKR